MNAADLARDLERVEGSLPGPLGRAASPFLVMLVGLPGAGKSTVARELSRRLRAAVVESDAVRSLLFPRPAFTEDESAWVFEVCHALVERLLRRGHAVVLDATNLIERHRQAVYTIAERRRAPLLVLRVEAPSEVVRQRLARRPAGSDSPSLATWDVYLRMRAVQEPILRPHTTIDTSQALGPALDAFERQVWEAVTPTERTVP